MLETSKERVKLLKMDIDGKTAEKLYIKHNCFKIIDRPILFDSIELMCSLFTENYKKIDKQ